MAGGPWGRRPSLIAPTAARRGCSKHAMTSDSDHHRLEAEYDPELRHRPMTRPADWIVGTLLVALAVFHYYASGFGVLRELILRGVHLSLVLSLIFLVFGATASAWRRGEARSTWLAPGGIPLIDIICALAVSAAALYLPLLPTELVSRKVGNPDPIDIVMGSLLVLLILEATRRVMGPTLPIIVGIFMLYAIFGQSAPGALRHPGASWDGLINHLYMTNQGVYGIAVGVVAQYVFLFVLFGVLATRIGLGQLFIDVASVIAGRYAGGPAKVSIFSSAMLGMISGSSIANTVTTGSLTIPAMKRIGYPSHFAAGVEATASTGGQITPPIMGAAAFIMVEFLEIPYRDVLLAALVPALLHYLGVLVMVHLEAKKLGLRGLREDEMPSLAGALVDNWPTLIPLGILITLIIMGRTPNYAAVWGITACVVVGVLNPRNRMSLRDLVLALRTGSQYALGVGAAAACVGVVIGVVTLTGMGFRLSFMVTQVAADIAGSITALDPTGLLAEVNLTLFLTLIFTAVACIIMGAGIPTTATYIILVSIAAPALALLGVPQVASHFFVFYYGVLADITPPVALAAYAAAGIAGANPFRAGNTAFRLAAAKALVPLVFVYSPAMLFIVEGFTWQAFFITVSGAIVGIVLLGAALIGYMVAPMGALARLLLGIAALCFVAPNLVSTGIGLVLSLPVLISQLVKLRRQGRDTAATG